MSPVKVTILAVFGLSFFSSSLYADEAAIALQAWQTSQQTTYARNVNGYTKGNGTYVAPHQRTDSNNTKLDNYSTKGNYNPYTGKKGTVDPYK